MHRERASARVKLFSSPCPRAFAVGFTRHGCFDVDRVAFGAIVGVMRTLLVLVLLLAACGDDSSRPDATLRDTSPDVSDGAADAFDAGLDTRPSCSRSIGDPDRERFVVLSHPFATPDNSFSVHRLSVDGELTATDEEFTMGRAPGGVIAFSADGVVGVVAQNDGTLGIFRMATNGAVTVLEAGRSGAAYASSVVADPSDIHVFWVLDGNTVGNDGGIYRLELDCDGAVMSDVLALAADLPYGLAFESTGQALVFARAAGESTSGDVHRVDLSTGAVSGSADIFEDTDWVGGGFAVSGAHAFAGDVSNFSALPNRVGVASSGDALGFAGRVEVEDPLAIFVSPFDDRLLVVSGFGDAFFVSDYDPTAPEPLSDAAELAYADGHPALPGAGVMIERGVARGLVLVSENQAVHRVRFVAGDVVDEGRYELGEGVDVIPGAIGVQP